MIRKLCIINEEWIETEFDSLHLEGWMPQKEFCPSKIRGEKRKKKKKGLIKSLLKMLLTNI